MTRISRLLLDPTRRSTDSSRWTGPHHRIERTECRQVPPLCVLIGTEHSIPQSVDRWILAGMPNEWCEECESYPHVRGCKFAEFLESKGAPQKYVEAS